jgi:signal transduction histidine kinase
MSIRHRLLLTLVPSLLLFALLGGAGIILLSEVSNRIQTVLSDNHENLAAVEGEGLYEALARIHWAVRVALYGFAGGLLATTLLAGLLAWHTFRRIIRPIQSITRSAQAIGAGNLSQMVPVWSYDEIGELAETFNRMTRQLRDYRQTHLASLLRAQRTSQATIDSFPDPVLVVDPAGQVEMANPAARQVLGISLPPRGTEAGSNSPGSANTPRAIAWQPPEALVRPLADALQGHRPFLTQAFEQTISFRAGGEERAYLPQILPIEDPFGNTLGAAIVFNDVTRFRLLDQLKSNLVATVSHELKTPLTSVRLVLHLLLEETVGPLTPKQTELVLDARDNAERLLNIIEHLLALARLEDSRHTLHIQAEAVQALLQSAADAIGPRAEAKHITVAVDCPPDLPPIAVDSARLAHALGNLLDNALAYTPEGGRITLSAAPADNGRVQLTVADTGSGIPPEYLPNIFHRFFRVPGQSHGRGTGLGLSIVREIVTAHGGEITCDSQPGQGTAFRLTLPLAAVSSQS